MSTKPGLDVLPDLVLNLRLLSSFVGLLDYGVIYLICGYLCDERCTIGIIWSTGFRLIIRRQGIYLSALLGMLLSLVLEIDSP